MILETPRLYLLKFTLDDAEFIVELLNSTGWLRFIGDRGVKTVTDAENYLLNGPIKSYTDNGFGLWLVISKEDKRKIGMCGLIKRLSLNDVDIGFAFLPEYEKKGYGTEIATATLNYGQNILGLKTIIAITNPENDSSIKLLNKIGLKFEKKFVHDGKEELFLFSTN
jgi:RimJ/RimL family protein N-acetyltransferase